MHMLVKVILVHIMILIRAFFTIFQNHAFEGYERFFYEYNISCLNFTKNTLLCSEHTLQGGVSRA